MFEFAIYSEPFGHHFGLVMIVGTILAFEVLVFARIFGGMPRRIFNKKFMDEHFGELHKQAFGEEIGGGGFPDTGSGFYSQKLSYKQWWEFNKRQRVHLHLVQWIATYLFLLVTAGAYFPLTAASIGLGIFIVRIWYSLAYVKYGPKARWTPFVVNVFLTISLGIISMLSGVKHLVRG